MRQGNEDILDNLEEGLIILEDNNVVVFHNKAAKRFSAHGDKSLSLSISNPDQVRD